MAHIQAERALHPAAALGVEPSRRTGWAGRWRAWRPTLIDASVAFLSSRLAVALVGYFAFRSINRNPAVRFHEVSELDLVNIGWRWDALWYLTIARDGYGVTSGDSFNFSNYAFWPFYPLLIRIGGLLTGGQKLPLVGIVVSLAAFFIALGLFHRLVLGDHGRKTARRTVYAFAFFPTAFFFSCGYSEGVLMASVLGAFLAARRGHWWLAGACGAMASATHTVGILLIPALAWEYMAQRGWNWRSLRWSVLALAVIPVGLGAFMGYLGWTTGDPLKFVSASKAWSHHWDFPWLMVWNAWNQFAPDPGRYAREVIGACLTLLIVVALIFYRKRLRGSYLVWCAAVLTLYLSLPAWLPFDSMSRYALHLFPGFLALAFSVQRWPNWAQLWGAVSLAGLGFLTALFAAAYWVA